ncbi:hypothetical protein HU759_018265 [Pseudomonas sp. OE 28.3]|uniref:hypothetical protein n=1 Tax=Pseudomonas sp. OE 28.3 TaxID=2745519 RepID=UPI001647E1D7|nr:hypothetical protein [Pseudomonas sp. OE 28.3]QXI57050.1 hypothetical protein HU759_018265 [Pseudomonas sp. OE 28.3]
MLGYLVRLLNEEVFAVFKGYIVAMLAVAISTLVAAEELPQGPLLQRFGDAINELPKPASPPEAKATPRELRIEGQEALNHPGRPAMRDMEKTGNPSIDNMHARDRDACRRVQAAALGQGRGLSLVCE